MHYKLAPLSRWKIQRNNFDCHWQSRCTWYRELELFVGSCDRCCAWKRKKKKHTTKNVEKEIANVDRIVQVAGSTHVPRSSCSLTGLLHSLPNSLVSSRKAILSSASREGFCFRQRRGQPKTHYHCLVVVIANQYHDAASHFVRLNCVKHITNVRDLNSKFHGFWLRFRQNWRMFWWNFTYASKYIFQLQSKKLQRR